MHPAVLVIAGTDSSGGAGLTRDAQTLSRFGVEARCVVTAVTAQTDSAVIATLHIAPDLVRHQLTAALQTGGIGAIKIGMVATRETIEVLVEALPPRDSIPIVLDPVLISSSGAMLLEPAAQRVLIERLLPRVTLLTPNLPEASQLLGTTSARDRDSILEQARKLLALGPEAVLLKDGHGTGAAAIDLLLGTSISPTPLKSKRVNATLRGTGCALSSAIAACLAQRLPLEEACRRAKQFVWNELRQASALSSTRSSRCHY
jgi:hydroxymethylpyrimidine/phosphomethylpyrimidine kinase